MKYITCNLMKNELGHKKVKVAPNLHQSYIVFFSIVKNIVFFGMYEVASLVM